MGKHVDEYHIEEYDDTVDKIGHWGMIEVQPHSQDDGTRTTEQKGGSSGTVGLKPGKPEKVEEQ